jgi:hypothetical protein
MCQTPAVLIKFLIINFFTPLLFLSSKSKYCGRNLAHNNGLGCEIDLWVLETLIYEVVKLESGERLV